MNDKFKTCKDCPDRQIEPNCHMHCEGYLCRTKRSKEISEKKKQEVAFNSYKVDRIQKTKKLYEDGNLKKLRGRT